MVQVKVIHFRIEHSESVGLFEHTLNSAVCEMEESGCGIMSVDVKTHPMSGIAMATMTATIVYDTVDRAEVGSLVREKVAAAIEILEQPIDRVALPHDMTWNIAEPLSEWFKSVDEQRKDAVVKLRQI